jgi:hypothetical protein
MTPHRVIFDDRDRGPRGRPQGDHARGARGPFAGGCGEAYLQDRWHIGLTHVRVDVMPWRVEAMISFPGAGIELIEERPPIRPVERPSPSPSPASSTSTS